MNHEVTKMKKFEDKLFAIVNYNELNILGIEDKKIERTVLFQDMNITTLHITEQYLMIADHFNFVYVIKKADLEVRDKQWFDLSRTSHCTLNQTLF